MSISVFAGLGTENDKLPPGLSVSRTQSGEEAAGRGLSRGLRMAAPRWLRRRRDEVSTDKVRGLMDGQSEQLDVRMDEGRGGI